MHYTRLLWVLTLIMVIVSFPIDVDAEAEKLWQHHLWCECDSYHGCMQPRLAVTDSGYVYLTYLSSDDMKILMYDPLGNLVWERTYGDGGNSVTRPDAITVDGAGNVYISAAYDPDCGVYELKNMALVTVKYSPEGTLIWHHRYTVPGVVWPPSISDNVLSSDNVSLYVAGAHSTMYPYPPEDPSNPQWLYMQMLLRYDLVSGALEWSKDSTDNVVGLAPAPSGGVYTAGNRLADEGWCIDTLTNDSVYWSRGALKVVHYGSDGSVLGLAEYTDDNFEPCIPKPHSWGTGPLNVVSDGQFNVYFMAQIRGSTGPRLYLFKYNSSLGFDWVTEADSGATSNRTDLLVDGTGNIILTTEYGTFKFDEAGNHKWTGQGGSFLGVDRDNNLYVGNTFTGAIEFYDQNEVDPYPEWSIVSPGGPLRDLYVDSLGQIYTTNWGPNVCGYVRVGMFAQEHFIRLGDAGKDSLGNMEFELYKVHNDPPYFTEDTLGNFVTDSLGIFKFPLIADNQMVFPSSLHNPFPDTLSRGDTLRIGRRVTDSATVKHPHLTENMYTICLDNLNFDSLGGTSYDTIITGLQNIEIDHAEIRYNLVVSVEWDASKEYLESLEANFRSMANYLYDITDGQARLDTVLIYDDSAHWQDADIHIYADNQQWPLAYVDSIHSAGTFTISMPRMWFGNGDATRNNTYHNHPLDLDDPRDYRTKTHEFGHYAFGFYDEYIYWDPDANQYKADPLLRCVGIPYYGFMEYQYPAADPYTTEMSNSYHYEYDPCKNTQQYGKCNASCWDYFESKFEGDYINGDGDTIFVEIFKPDDTNRNSYAWPSGYVYLEGPNNDMASPLSLDYDVGSKIVFPVAPRDPAAGISEVDVEIQVGGVVKPKADVFLMKYLAPLVYCTIEQGQTADNGRIWVLGAKTGDIVASAGFNRSITKSHWGNEIWNSGEAVVDGDTLTLALTPVDGYFPLICEVTLNETSFEYQLTAENTFASLPSITYRPSPGGQFDYTFNSITNGYAVALAESPGQNGYITVNAVDNSSNPFFFFNSYTHSTFTPSASGIELFGPGGEVQILFDAGNPAMAQAMFLSSPYLVIRTGLTETNIQAGKAHSLSVYPADAMTGSGLLRIFYSESDIVAGGGLAEDEASLAIFKWIDRTTGWIEIGGTVDTVLNQVIETITEPGVYAAFTTDGAVDVEDEEHGDILPYRFELSQNYPNPFNPVTTIEYNLPRRNHVTIEIYNVLGQKVRTLVDREESAGSYTITWDGTSIAGTPVATGVYLYRFQAGDHVETKKMLLLK